VHQHGHEYNAARKEEGKSGVETWGVYKTVSPKKAEKGEWSKEVDHKRADYHKAEAEKSGWGNIW
jgi:hypothetical protein